MVAKGLIATSPMTGAVGAEEELETSGDINRLNLLRGREVAALGKGAPGWCGRRRRLQGRGQHQEVAAHWWSPTCRLGLGQRKEEGAHSQQAGGPGLVIPCREV